ncbi:MAG: zinc-binding dehydrogenase, partial [Treponema sp.]|nr:zinc-binding dehydrogenase [Treponema sp.]
DGVFQEYVAHQGDLCFKLPEKVSTMEGALIEPLAVGFHAAMTGGARIGQTALVTGAGCIGLVSMLALKAQGVSRVYITDVVGKRLEKAGSLGAEEAINAAEQDPLQVIAEREEVDLVIETTGTDAAAAQGIKALKKGGTMVFVGYSKTGSMTLPMGLALDKELTLKTIFRYRHIYPLAIDAVARGAVDIKSIVTNIFDFDDIRNAMERSVHDKAEIVKSVVKINNPAASGRGMLFS